MTGYVFRHILVAFLENLNSRIAIHGLKLNLKMHNFFKHTEFFEPVFVKFGVGISDPLELTWAFWSRRQADPCFAYIARALLLLWLETELALPTCNCCEEDERLLGVQELITLLLMFIADPEFTWLFGVKLELRRPRVFKLVVEDLRRGEESDLQN